MFTLIQSFFGTDDSRISACEKAIRQLLNLDVLPNEWIFIECQRDEVEAKFRWVKNHGIRYMFRLMSVEDISMHLKMPLWEIASQYANNDKLVFLDADVAFDSPTWVRSASIALDKYEIIQPAGWYHEDGSNAKAGTLAYSVMKSQQNGYNKFVPAHPGYCLGMTKHTLRRLGGFDKVRTLDDHWFWAKIIGVGNAPKRFFMLPKPPDENMKTGLNLSIGSTEESCVHFTHSKCHQKAYANAVIMT